jgi:hypothetical protein
MAEGLWVPHDRYAGQGVAGYGRMVQGAIGLLRTVRSKAYANK